MRRQGPCLSSGEGVCAPQVPALLISNKMESVSVTYYGTLVVNAD